MADSYNKKEREKKRNKRKKEKKERKEQRKQDGVKEPEFMYLDENGNLTPEPPDPTKKREIKAEDIEIGVPSGEKEPIDTERKGVVKFFNYEKGYGFIIDSDSKESLFVHANNLTVEIADNDKVTFKKEAGPKGPVAVEVKLA